MDLHCNTSSQNNSHSKIQFVQLEEDKSNAMMNSQGTISLDPYGQVSSQANVEEEHVTYQVSSQANVEEEHVTYQVIKGEDGQTQLVPIPDIVQLQNGIQEQNAVTIPAEPEGFQSLLSSGEITPYNLPTSSFQVTYIPSGSIDPASVATTSQNGAIYYTRRENATLVQERNLSKGLFDAMNSPHDVFQHVSTPVIASPEVNEYHSSEAQRR